MGDLSVEVRDSLEKRRAASGKGFALVLGSAGRAGGRGVKHGVGRSAVADAIAAEIKAERVSTGNFFRDMAKERGMSIEQFHKRIPDHPEWDADLDRRVAAMISSARSSGRFVVIDSNLAAIIGEPDCAFRIDVSDTIRAKRVMAGKRHGDSAFGSEKEALDHLDRRSEEEMERYSNHPDPMYKGIDLAAGGRFTATIDNSGAVEQTVAEILRRVLEWLEFARSRDERLYQRAANVLQGRDVL
jgi:cytidylate kinase